VFVSHEVQTPVNSVEWDVGDRVHRKGPLRLLFPVGSIGRVTLRKAETAQLIICTLFFLCFFLLLFLVVLGFQVRALLVGCFVTRAMV
jgi:hypothetical protein